MARLVPVRCPNCGANVRIDPDRDIATCDYCKTSSFVQTRTRPVPEAVRRDNSPVIDVEAFRSSLRPSLAFIWVYALGAFGIAVIGVVTFVTSLLRSKPAPSPSSNGDPLEQRLREGPESSAEPTPDAARSRPSVAAPPTFSAGEVVVSGRLSSEVVQKVVRQHFNRFRLCHEQAERRSGNAYGTVTLRFVIGRDGGVSHTTVTSWSVQSGTYVECVETAFAGMLFPKPAGGVVTVVYSLVAKPG
jgi:outer membrane biosynthesis protein TonB